MNSETKICNQALSRLGAQRINDLGDNSDTLVEAIHCRLHYEQTRNELQRSHWWRMNKARAVLSLDTETPAFEWSYQHFLPNDFLRMRSVFGDNTLPNNTTVDSYSLEGKLLLSDDETVKIRYSKLVTDVTEFDPLFVKVLVLELALKLVIPLSISAEMQESIQRELAGVMPKVRALDREEGDTIRRAERSTWNDARFSLGRSQVQLDI